MYSPSLKLLMYEYIYNTQYAFYFTFVHITNRPANIIVCYRYSKFIIILLYFYIYTCTFILVLLSNSLHSTLKRVKYEKQILPSVGFEPTTPAFVTSVLLLDHKGPTIEIEQHR